MNLVRAGLAVLTVLTSGTALVAYLVAWAVIPAEGSDKTMLGDAIGEGRRLYAQQRTERTPSAEPGAAPRTPAPQPRPQQAPRQTFNLYED